MPLNFKKEIEEISFHYIKQFSFLIYYYIFGITLLSITNYFVGAYKFLIFNIIGLIPILILVIRRLILYKKLIASKRISAITLFVLFVLLVVGNMFYVKDYPFLNGWFIIFFYAITPISFQKASLPVNLIVVLAIVGINTIPFLDLSPYRNETLRYEVAFKYINISLMVFTVVVFEIINNRIFERILGNILVKNKELELYKSNQSNMQKIKDVFFATISHEMRTPLNAIKGISDMLVEDDLNEKEIIDYQKLMNYSSNHLLNLVNDVIDYTKINMGQFNLNNQPFDFEENIKFSFEISRKIASQKDIEYKLEKLNEVPKFVIADTQRFNQILMNLLTNALKFTEKGFVKLSYGGTYNDEGVFVAKIIVSDSGIGISEDALENVFERYFQAKNHQVQSGVGLGLYITHSIITAMKGTVNVESKLNVGTSFIVELPLDIDDNNQIKSKEVNAELIEKLSNLKILVAEDNKINQIVITKLLNKHIPNCLTKIANDGQEVLDEIEINHYDIILMDLLMPKLGGIETTLKIRNHHIIELRKTPIIAITANVWENDFNLSLEAGINDFITKPFDINQLLIKINDLINKS